MLDSHPRYAACAAAHVPADSRWLSPREREVEAGLRLDHRRLDWRAGRWACKTVLRATGLISRRVRPWRIEILAGPDGAPRAYLDHQAIHTELSISHRDGWATAAIHRRVIGIDLERVEKRSERFVRDFFCPQEVETYFSLPKELRDIYAVGVWSAKEAVLKCAHTGLRRDTRTVDVQLAPASESSTWHRFSATDLELGHRLCGWWSLRGTYILSTVSPDPIGFPVPPDRAYALPA